MTPKPDNKFGGEGGTQSSSTAEVVNPNTSQVKAVTAASAKNDLSTVVPTQIMANSQVFSQRIHNVDRSVDNITYIPTQQIQTGGQGSMYLSTALPQTFQTAGNQTILTPEQTFVQTPGIQMPTSIQNGQTLLLHSMTQSSSQIDGQNVTIGQGSVVPAFQLQQFVPVQLPVSNHEGHTVLQTVYLPVQFIQNGQGIHGANIFQLQEEPITVNVSAEIAPQLASQNAEEKAVSATTAAIINGTSPPPQQQQQQYQQQQYHHQQQQMAVANFQPPNGQVGQGQISQIITGGTAALLPMSSISVQGLTGLRPANAIQVQGHQEQQIVENAHIFEPALNVVTTNVVSAATNFQQQMSSLSPIQSVHGAQFINLSAQQLQQVPTDPSKWHVTSTAVNPVIMSTPTQYPQVTGSRIPFTYTSTVATSIKPSTVKKDINTRRNRRSCTCANCVNGRNSRFKKKQHSCDILGCNKVYAKTSHLRSHLLGHTGERPFGCSWERCEKRFTRSDELQRHYKIHIGDKKFACSLCDKRFIRSDHLAKHSKTHQNNGKLNNGNKKTKI